MRLRQRAEELVARRVHYLAVVEEGHGKEKAVAPLLAERQRLRATLRELQVQAREIQNRMQVVESAIGIALRPYLPKDLQEI